MAFKQGNDGPNDLSDISASNPAYSEVSAQQLPIRGEKRIIPSQVNVADITTQQTNANHGKPNPNGIKPTSFTTVAALPPFIDYVFIRIPHRGITAQGKLDTNGSATFRFLINPSTV